MSRMIHPTADAEIGADKLEAGSGSDSPGRIIARWQTSPTSSDWAPPATLTTAAAHFHWKERSWTTTPEDFEDFRRDGPGCIDWGESDKPPDPEAGPATIRQGKSKRWAPVAIICLVVLVILPMAAVAWFAWRSHHPQLTAAPAPEIRCIPVLRLAASVNDVGTEDGLFPFRFRNSCDQPVDLRIRYRDTDGVSRNAGPWLVLPDVELELSDDQGVRLYSAHPVWYFHAVAPPYVDLEWRGEFRVPFGERNFNMIELESPTGEHAWTILCL